MTELIFATMSKNKLKNDFKNSENNRLLPMFILSVAFIFVYTFSGNLIHFSYADFTFTAAGDWGCTSNTDATVTNMQARNPGRVFGLGDYSYASTGSCWWNKLTASIDNAMEIAFGNHEDSESEGLSGYKSHFGISQTYYAYTNDVARVIVMDTDVADPVGSAQKSFVQSELQSAPTNPSIKWIIVYLHKPFYTSPNSCSSGGCTNSDSDTAGSLRNNYGPMFDQYGVDLVLQGHVHNYQRTFQLKYDPGSPSSPTIGSSNANTYTEGNGAVYAIVGTGGQGFHPLEGKASFVSSQQDDDFGQLEVKITNSGNKLEGKFYRNGDKAILDSFSITKAAPGGNYKYAPGLVLTGSNYQDVPSSPSLQLSQFSVAAWFKTSADFGSDSFIVNKGGVGSDSAGQNMNYAILMTSTERVRAGFETSTGADFYATSPASYSDNKWHYAVVTYGGSTIVLYIDGVQVATASTSGASPETSGTKPVRVGANSRVTPPTTNFFTGEVDEIRVWRDDLTATEQANAFAGASFNTGEQVLHLPFSGGAGGVYHYSPGLVLTGSNYNDTPSSPALQIASFSVAAWFKTSTNYGSDAFIANKGGIGSDAAGQNMNYGIWMTSAETIRAGFESSTGADFFVTSANTFNDNQWHYAVVTYGGTNVILYVDGVQVATKAASGVAPEKSGTLPVRVGANSRVTPPGNFFIGEVDEVRVWNDDLSAAEQANAFAGTSFNTGEQVLYLSFSTAALTAGYNYGPSLELTGPTS